MRKRIGPSCNNFLAQVEQIPALFIPAQYTVNRLMTRVYSSSNKKDIVINSGLIFVIVNLFSPNGINVGVPQL